MPAYTKNDQLGRTIKKVGTRKATTEKESTLQDECENHLKVQGISYLHIPQSAYQHRRSKSVLAGWPDLMIFEPDGKYNRSLFIELKKKGGKPTGHQKRKARRLNVMLIDNFEDFREQLELFLNGGA